MSCNEVIDGDEVIVEMSLTFTDNTTVPNDFFTMGAVRNAPISLTSNVVDVSTGDSDGWMEKHTTQKSSDNSIDGVLLKTLESNLDAIEDYHNDGSGCAWLRLTRPSKNASNKVYTLPILITGWDTPTTYNEVLLYTMNYESTGKRVITYN